MSSPETLDLTGLMQPIPGPSPVGSDLRRDVTPNSPYFKLKTARSQASALERAGASDPDAAAQSVVQWRTIQELAVQVLREKSKDLQVCAWLIESLVRSKGFPGLRDGFRLARELCEQHWDALHPRPDEDGMSTRVAPLTGLNGEDSEGTLIAPIARVPITNGVDGNSFATWHWVKATSAYAGNTSDEGYAAKQQQYELGNAELRAKIEAAVRQSSASYYVELKADLDQTLEEHDKLVALLDQKCGADSPPSSSIRNAIRSVSETVTFVAKDLLPAPVVGTAGAGGEGAGAAAGGGSNGMPGAIDSREAAFAALKRVADYFRRAEPHSPISYIIEQAVRFGGLSLPELLTELIPDDGSRSQLFTRTGMTPPAKPAS